MRWLLILLAGCDGVFGVRFIDPLIDASPDAPPDAQSTYKTTILGDHPVAYFPLDEVASARTAIDLVSGLTGQVQGLAMGGADPPFPAANHAYTFDGNSGSVELGDVFPFTDKANFTIEAWVLNDHTDAFNYAIASKWRQPDPPVFPPSGWLFYYQEGVNLTPSFKIQRQDATGAGFVASATATQPGPMWHHVVGTYDGTNLAIYLDGAYVASHVSSEALEHLDLPLEIGAQNGNSHDGVMAGSIDEVAIYDYALSDAQISKHYGARSL